MINSNPTGGDDTDQTIPFTDEAIENAEAIRIFLGLVVADLSQDLFTDDGVKLMAAVPFLDKYNCQQPKKVLGLMTTDMYSNGNTSLLTAFVHAARLDNDRACVTILERGGLGGYPYRRGTGRDFPLRFMGFFPLVRSLPVKYSHALLSAMACHIEGTYDGMDVFERALLEAKVSLQLTGES